MPCCHGAEIKKERLKYKVFLPRQWPMFVLYQLTEESTAKVLKARQMVEDIVREDKVVYGITTGFGKFARTKIETGKLV